MDAVDRLLIYIDVVVYYRDVFDSRLSVIEEK